MYASPRGFWGAYLFLVPDYAMDNVNSKPDNADYSLKPDNADYSLKPDYSDMTSQNSDNADLQYAPLNAIYRTLLLAQRSHFPLLYLVFPSIKFYSSSGCRFRLYPCNLRYY